MGSAYKRLLSLLTVNAAVMLAITYVTVWEPGHVHLNVNRAYMAIMMAAPMGILMLLVMGHMFTNRTLNMVLHTAFLAVFATAFLLVRSQTPVGDGQFLRSMIPHHSGAILMCQRAALTDPEIIRLCKEIVQSQQEEIARMEAIMRRPGPGSS